MSRSDMLSIALPCALLGGFGGMLPQEFFFKMVQFGTFWCIFGSDSIDVSNIHTCAAPALLT